MDTKFIPRSSREKKVCVVVGTRPGIVKMSPIIRELGRRELPFFILHTGQHYSPNMDSAFFLDLGLPKPSFHLQTVKEYATHASQTAEMMKGIESALFQERPSIVLVCGDANTNLSGALAARKLGLIVGHVESGLRSHDWRMPEEHNRVIMDHISELLFAPTEQAKSNLIDEKVRGKIYVTGNTIVDASLQNVKISERKSQILRSLDLCNRKYALITAHREENVDDTDNLKAVVSVITKVSTRYRNFEFVFPIHPRTRKRMDQAGMREALDNIPNLKVIDPIGYLDFLLLMSRASVVLTDSGGIQEESCILKVPCITLRENTERPESIDVGANVLAGLAAERVNECMALMLNRARTWSNPFGDGNAAEKISDIADAVLSGEIDMSEFDIQ